MYVTGVFYVCETEGGKSLELCEHILVVFFNVGVVLFPIKYGPTSTNLTPCLDGYQETVKSYRMPSCKLTIKKKS